MELHKDAVKALEYHQKEDQRDFGDLDEEKSLKEEDLLASLMDDLDMWKGVKCFSFFKNGLPDFKVYTTP